VLALLPKPRAQMAGGRLSRRLARSSWAARVSARPPLLSAPGGPPPPACLPFLRARPSAGLFFDAQSLPLLLR
jgi:hypothetical protein